MFKLIVIAVVLYVFFKKMPRTRKLAQQKFDSARTEFSSRAPEMKEKAYATVDMVKEESRGILIRVLIFVIGVLSSLLGMLLAGVASGNTNTDIERR